VYFDDTLYEDEEEKEESGVLAGLRKCSEIARLKGLTADEPEFRRVLLQKLQLVSLKLRSCEIVASDRRGSWHGELQICIYSLAHLVSIHGTSWICG
jgi:hypothetical protein